MKRMDDLVRHLGLQPHPEGGWYRETWRATEIIASESLPSRFPAARCHGTAIYYLLGPGDFSALHRIRSDELWHFYAGSTLRIHVIEPNGDCRTERLGSDLAQGDRYQVMVPHGCWFGADVEAENGFSLVGCTVSPGFDFADFELGERRALLRQYPQHKALINALTRE